MPPRAVFAEGESQGEAQVEVAENVAEALDRTETRLRYLEPRPGVTLVVPDDPPTVEGKRLFEALTEEERVLFEERRLSFLRRLASVLSHTRMTLGTGVYLKNRIVRILPSQREKTPLKSIGEHGRETIQAILQAANQQVYEHAPVVARANEFGFNLTVTGNLGAAGGSRGVYQGLGLGLNIGYNTQSRDLGFELFLHHEGLIKATPASAEVVARAQGYGYAATREPGTEGKPFHGRLVYPPGPAGIIDNANEIHMGLHWALGLGLPVQLGLQNSVNRFPLLRIAVSPIRPGFVTVGGALGDAAKMVVMPVARVIGWVLRNTARLARNTAHRCWAGFSAMLR